MQAMPNTIVIFEAGDGVISFYVLEGDHSHLDRIWIGLADGEDEKQEELSDLLFDDTGNQNLTGSQEFPHASYRPQATSVIVCGLVP